MFEVWNLFFNIHIKGYFSESINRQKILVEDIVADWNQLTNPGSMYDMADFEKSSVRWSYNLNLAV